MPIGGAMAAARCISTRATGTGAGGSTVGRMNRKLGPVRPPGTREGLTRAQAERALRRQMEAELAQPSVAERLTVAEAGARLLTHLEGLGRKRSTLQGYESFLRVHLAPFFGDRPLQRIEPRDVEAFIAASRRSGQSVK
jgi:hypothetical protein